MLVLKTQKSYQRNNQIKLTHYNETRKIAHDSHTVRAKETSRATLGAANDKHKAPINRIKLYVRAVIESEA